MTKIAILSLLCHCYCKGNVTNGPGMLKMLVILSLFSDIVVHICLMNLIKVIAVVRALTTMVGSSHSNWPMTPLGRHVVTNNNNNRTLVRFISCLVMRFFRNSITFLLRPSLQASGDFFEILSGSLVTIHSNVHSFKETSVFFCFCFCFFFK